jgi:hypothetical protein
MTIFLVSPLNKMENKNTELWGLIGTSPICPLLPNIGRYPELEYKLLFFRGVK